jgi:hypothetical protein
MKVDAMGRSIGGVAVEGLVPWEEAYPIARAPLLLPSSG